MRRNPLYGMMLFIFILGVALPLWAAEKDPKPEQSWNNLKQLPVGTRIQVVSMDMKSVKGVLLWVTDEALNFRTSKGEQSWSRDDVYRVKNRERNHHVRNGLIGMAAGAGILAAVAAGSIDDNCIACGTDRSQAAVGAVAGAAIGSIGFAFGSHKTVYKAERVTQKKKSD